MNDADSGSVFPSAGICLGIDPTVNEGSGRSSARFLFEESLQAHLRVLEQLKVPYALKPNVAYFLRFGSWGIGRLEEFCDNVRSRFPILIDGKFGEISTSLEAYLDFVFGHLGAQAVTLNPFMGERVITLGLEKCMSATGGKGRIYVLCATSESGGTEGNGLGALQDVERIARVCAEIAKDSAESCALGSVPPVGLVIGANREDVFASSMVRTAQLPLLCPGLGAQGANWEVAKRQLQASEGRAQCLFPLSRYVFGGGRTPLEESLRRVAEVHANLGL